MNKFRLLLFTVCCLFFGILNVNAYSTSISGNKSITPGEKFKVTISLGGAEDLWGTVGKLTYDSSKLTLNDSSGANGFTVTLGTNLLADATKGANGNVSYAVLTFTATGSFKIGETTTITLGTQEGSNGSGTILTGTGSSLTITMAAPKSTNNYLKSLTVDKGTINFSSQKTSYSLVVDNDVQEININAIVEDETAKVSGTGKKTLKVYANTFNIVVTAENGSKRTYKVIVNRKDENGKTSQTVSDVTLKSLTIPNFNIEFNKDILEYTIEIENDIEDLEIIAIANNSDAKVTVNKPDKFEVGENIISIEIEDETGEINTYQIKVFKKALEETSVEEDKTTPQDNNIFKTLFIIESIVFVISIITLIILFAKKTIIIRKY